MAILSARSYTRVVKLGRTIADLAGSNMIELHQVAEALSYRSLDRMPDTLSVKKTTHRKDPGYPYAV